MALLKIPREQDQHPAPDHIANLYHEAFAKYRTLCMWSTREMERPTISDVLDAASRLKREGNMTTRALAVRIEESVNALT